MRYMDNSSDNEHQRESSVRRQGYHGWEISLTKPETFRKWASRKRDGAESKEMMGKQGWVGTGSPGKSEFFREATSEGPDAVIPAGKLQFSTNTSWSVSS